MAITFSKADLNRLAQIVREETGNEVNDRNFSMIESRVRSRMMELGVSSLEQYWELFQNNERQEREALKGLLTTHHTFFFREYAHFEVLESWLTQNHDFLKGLHRPIKVWSAACSRGQEAYSLAMFLEDHAKQKRGLDFQIFGTDIDSNSVEYAKNAVYPLSEVYSIPQNYLAQHWKRGSGAVKDFAAIKPELKTKLNFEALNLLHFNEYPSQDFDVIFCRNVFIYFSPENVAKIASHLASKLSSIGLFVSGVSEPLRFEGWNLSSVGPSCYQKQQAQSEGEQSRPAENPVASPKESTTTLKPHLPTAQQQAEPSRTYRVLCVDDSPTIQKLMTKIFSQDPLCKGVDLANHGGEARLWLDKNSYQLITLDIHMPEVNGIEFLERLYQRQTDPPVLMISSVNRTDKDLALKSLKLGAFDYVEKPSMNQLTQSASEILIKAKMAMRSAGQRLEPTKTLSFDQSVAQSIVVPDASQSLRIVIADSSSSEKLKQLLETTHLEMRSPPLVIAMFSDDDRRIFEKVGLESSERKLLHLRRPTALKPQHHYLIEVEELEELLKQYPMKYYSVQFLCEKGGSFLSHLKNSNVQFLLDETLISHQMNLERNLRLKIHEVAPSTSFCSLSLEYFAGARKAAA